MKIRRFAAVGVAVCVLAVAGCSSSGGNKAGTPGTGSGTPTSGSSGSAKAASTSGTVDVGFASEFTGTAAFPAIKQAGVAAAAYVNAHGGLAGKKLNLVVCDMKNNNQAAQECGQQFANDTSMPFAIMALTFNGGPFYAAMNAAHKPVLGGTGITPADNSPKDVYFYFPGATFYYSIAQAIKQEGWKSVSYIYQDNAAITPGTDIVRKELAGSGVNVKYTAIPAGSSDPTPQVASAGIATSEATVIIAPNGCTQVVSSMQSLNLKPKTVMTTDSCLTRAAVTANPALYEGWLDATSTQLATSGSTGGPDVQTFLKGWKQYGPGGTPGTFAELGWGTVLTAATVFANAKTITSASANTAIASYKGAVAMGLSSISCPGPATATASCATGLIFYKITNGELIPAKP